MITFRVVCWNCEHKQDFESIDNARWHARHHFNNEKHLLEILAVGKELIGESLER